LSCTKYTAFVTTVLLSAHALLISTYLNPTPLTAQS
jgi:hypothetical protein